MDSECHCVLFAVLKIYKTLEKKIASFYGTEDTILYAAAFDANGGVFEPLLGEGCYNFR
jgi:7-keto-8-aminopelargonate synthetase-like enzyme